MEGPCKVEVILRSDQRGAVGEVHERYLVIKPGNWNPVKRPSRISRKVSWAESEAGEAANSKSARSVSESRASLKQERKKFKISNEAEKKIPDLATEEAQQVVHPRALIWKRLDEKPVEGEEQDKTKSEQQKMKKDPLAKLNRRPLLQIRLDTCEIAVHTDAKKNQKTVLEFSAAVPVMTSSAVATSSPLKRWASWCDDAAKVKAVRVTFESQNEAAKWARAINGLLVDFCWDWPELTTGQALEQLKKLARGGLRIPSSVLRASEPEDSTQRHPL